MPLPRIVSVSLGPLPSRFASTGWPDARVRRAGASPIDVWQGEGVTRRQSSVLDACGRLFAEYRDRPIAMLAIGLDDRVSLDAWRSACPTATRLDGTVLAAERVGQER